MPGVKISELKETFTLNDTDSLLLWKPGPYNGSTYKISASVFGKHAEIVDLQNQASFITNQNLSLLNEKVSKSGDIMSGDLLLHEDPNVPEQAVTKRYVDNKYSILNRTWASLKCP